MNATGKEGMRYDAEELRAQAAESRQAGRPEWVARAAEEQAEELEAKAFRPYPAAAYIPPHRLKGQNNV